MNISNVYSSQPLPITYPDGSPSGLVLQVVGQDSKAFREVAKKFAKQMLGTDARPDIDHLEQQNGELIAACIVGWSGLDDATGSVPYSADKAVELMLTPELSFIREQVEGFAGKRTNFFRAGQETA